jgi:hypothetical protein
MVTAFVILVGVNAAGMQVRVRNTNRCGDSLRGFVARVEAIKRSAPSQHLRVFMTTDDLEQGLRMLELQGIIRYEDGLLGPPLTAWPPPGETWVIASYRKRHPFETSILSTPK